MHKSFLMHKSKRCLRMQKSAEALRRVHAEHCFSFSFLSFHFLNVIAVQGDSWHARPDNNSPSEVVAAGLMAQVRPSSRCRAARGREAGATE